MSAISVRVSCPSSLCVAGRRSFSLLERGPDLCDAERWAMRTEFHVLFAHIASIVFSISANIISAIAFVPACVSMSQMLVTCVSSQARSIYRLTSPWYGSITWRVHKLPARSSSLEALRRHMYIDVSPCVIILHSLRIHSFYQSCFTTDVL